MRIYEVISTDDLSGSIANDLMDMIVAYLDKKQTKISMPDAIVYLKKLGYSIDPSGIMNLLDTPKFEEVVKQSNLQHIELYPKTIDQKISKDEMDINQEKVEKEAEKAATKATKAGEQI